MAMGGDGPWSIAVMWVLTLITFLFVILRFYTRGIVVHSYGVDDHVFNFAFVLLLLYTVATTISAQYGFGQNMSDIPTLDDLANAILFEAIGQTFAVVGMAVAKWSLGLFLLRLVTQRWQKVAIWLTMLSLMGASISVCFVFWLQCTPPAYLWDRRIPGGYCSVDSTPVSLTLCILCVFTDFFFAIFPWTFLWGLQMNQREKLVIAGSLSLGFFAGACGIKRTVEVPSLSSENYTKETVGLIVWSAAEIAVTMVCIGIPVCRPLYKRWLEKFASNLSGTNSGYKKHGSSSRGPRYGLRTIGGSTMPGATQWRPETDGNASDGCSGDGTSDGDVELGKGGSSSGKRKVAIAGPFNEATAVGGNGWNGSEEEILGEEFRDGQGGADKRRSDVESGAAAAGSSRAAAGGIHVTEEWRVEVERT